MKSSQLNIKLEHNCIIKPIEPPCTSSTKLAGHCSYEGDHHQLGLSMNLEACQEQEETKESLTVTCKLNRRLIPRIQATEQPRHRPAWQPSLRIMKHPTWCTYEQGNPRVVIFGHGILSQDLELARSVLTEPTRAAPRSRVRQLFDSG